MNTPSISNYTQVFKSVDTLAKFMCHSVERQDRIILWLANRGKIPGVVMACNASKKHGKAQEQTHEVMTLHHNVSA